MKNLINKTLQKYNIPLSIIEKYDENHRIYHNYHHIENMLKLAVKNDWISDDLVLAIIFHDIVYNINSDSNEEHSVELLKFYYRNDSINQAILSTKNHKPETNLSHRLCVLDTHDLYSDFKTFKDYDDKIFKEYQRYDYSTYLKSRLEILKKLEVKQDYIDYVSSRNTNIGLFAGSFNRFHVGHLNILEKAEKIFDKVIIAVGKNPNKSKETSAIPESIKNRQIIHYDGLLTDLINSLGYNVTLIRGLRNSIDLGYEISQYRYMCDLKPDIKVVNIICDAEFEHVSSSSIDYLEKYNKHEKYII